MYAYIVTLVPTYAYFNFATVSVLTPVYDSLLRFSNMFGTQVFEELAASISILFIDDIGARFF
jgi:hypothetical protein